MVGLTHRVPKSSPVATPPASQKLFAVALGLFLGLALLKFGNPAVMNKFVEAPQNKIEWLVMAWPLNYAYVAMVVLLITAVPAIRWNWPGPRWLFLLPLAWFGWQTLAAANTIDGSLTKAVLAYFAICVSCFYMAALGLREERLLPFFLSPLLVAFAAAIYVGLDQHFGGLEQSRQYFWTYVYPQSTNLPDEFIKKMQSDRIFSTVFYPNAFAGAILLLTPVFLAWIWQARMKFTIGARALLCAIILVGAGSCFFWTGSKAGWLVALAVLLLALAQMAVPTRLKLITMAVLLIVGGAGLYWKNRAYVQKGATSLVARFDYWQAALKTAGAHPIVGTGPGTFGLAYDAIRKPGSEMARLAHNDYLQQASDSGWFGCGAYLVFVVGTLLTTYRKLDLSQISVANGVWFGVLAWALQSIAEFNLYVPPLGWTAFALSGWLFAQVRQMESTTAVVSK